MSEKILSDILGKVTDTSLSVQNLDKKFELHKQKMSYEIKDINDLDKEQNRLIDEHIEGVRTLQAMHVEHRKESLDMINSLKDLIEVHKDEIEIHKKEIDTRLDILEKPSPWVIWLKQNKLIASILFFIAGGFLTTLKFWEELLKILGD